MNVIQRLFTSGNRTYGQWQNRTTQMHTIGYIFYLLSLSIGLEDKSIKISSRQIQTSFSILHMTQNLSDEQKRNISIEKLIHCSINKEMLDENNLIFIPGDLQRQLRTFFCTYEKFGLRKVGKDVYEWELIVLTDDDFNRLITDDIRAPRNIFKTKQERMDFQKEKGSSCEICKSKKRLAIDHFRAHSVYNIDTIDIAVLLCEHCNNIHHNYDGIHILENHLQKKILTMDTVWNWIDIERRVRENGHLPNDKDKNEQNTTIDNIVSWYNTIPENKNRWDDVINNLIKMKL